jgi:hypothetical protein
MGRYMNGTPIYLSNTIKDRTGALIDAGAHLITVQQPDGVTTTTYTTPTHDGLGLYHQDIAVTDLPANGHYLWKWQTTGAGAGMLRGDFDVFDPFEQSILSLQDAKDELNIPRTSTTSDDEIQLKIDSIESNIEMYIGGPVITRSVTERVKVSAGYTALVLRKTPVVAVTSITNVWSGQAAALTDLDVDTTTGIVRRKLNFPFIGWGPVYTVVYTAGLGTAVPATINQAARMILAHLWATQRGPQPRPYAGSAETVLPGMNFAIPNVAAELLRPNNLEAYV